MKAENWKDLGNGLEITTARSVEEIEAIRPVWEQMQGAGALPIPNADISRYLAFVQSAKGVVRPHIMLLCCRGRPKTVVIGRIEEHRIACRVGYSTVIKPTLRCLSILYGGILGQPSNEVCEVLLSELINTLKNRGADVVFLNHLRTDSHLYHLVKTMPSLLCRDHFLTVDLHWQTHIPNDVESFYKTIPSKHKREWRRCERRLADECKGEVEVVCYRNEEEVDYVMDVACSISALTYKQAMNVGIVNDTVTRELLRRAARDRWLLAYILYANGMPCAFEFGVCYGSVFFPEYMGYDPKWNFFGPGALLWVKVIEDLCADPQIDTLDYGFGNAAYKERLGTKSWEEASVYIFAPRVNPVLINVLRSSVSGLSLGLARILNKMGLAGWIKGHWRSLLQRNRSKAN